MVALIEIEKENTRIDVFPDKLSLAKEMKRRYNDRVSKATNINWSNTYFNEERLFCKVDEWNSVVEYRESEINICSDFCSGIRYG